MPEDRIAITSSKSDVDPCRHGRLLTAKKVRTDGFQLYIVEDNMLNKNTLGVKKVRGQSEATMVI